MEDRRLAGLLLFAGCALFLIGLLVAETTYPGYSVSENTISSLGVGPEPASTIFNVSIILFGGLGMMSAWRMREASVDRAIWATLLISGLGAIGVGLVHEDVRPYHSLAALAAFGGGSLLAILSYRIVRMPLGIISALMGATSLVALALFAVDVDLGMGMGGIERMVLYPTIVWITGLAAILMSEGGTPGRSG